MRIFFILGLMIPLFASTLRAEDTAATPPAGAFLIVKITDHSKTTSYKCMTSQEYKTLCSEIALEGRVWEKAMTASEKEWKSNPDTAKKSFPRNGISPQRAAISESFTSEEKATAKITAIEKRSADQDALEKKREDAKKQAASKSRGPAVKPNDNKQKADEQRNGLIKNALSIFESKLTECIAAVNSGDTPAGEAPEAKVAKPEPKAESKPEAKPDTKKKK